MTTTTSDARQITVDDILAAELEVPEYCARWERLAPARAVANRIEHDLTQTALGRRLGMPQPAVARLETGEHVPSLDTLIRLADALGIAFLVANTPAGKRPAWVARRAESATVVERVAAVGGGDLIVAAN